MNKIVSVPSEPQSPKNRPETQTPSVPITSLKKAMAFVNAQTHLSTEDLFKTLLVYHKPNQGMFATPREQAFLTAAINKGASSEGPVSAETQQRIALAIRDGQFGTPIRENVARAIATKLDAFTDREAQEDIALAIRSERFGAPTIPQDVALVIAAKLDTFTAPEAQEDIALAIRSGRFGAPTIPQDVALVIAAKLDTFTAPEAQRKSPFSPYFMSASFPFLDVKSVVKLLRVNTVVRRDMTAFLDYFRRPYVSLSTSILANVADLQPLIKTLERSVRDLGYGSDKLTMRLLPTPPSLTRDQLQAIPISPITIVYLLQNPANGRPLVAAGVHNPLSALLGDPQATPLAKEGACRSAL